MKVKLLTNWTIARVLCLLIGNALIIDSVLSNQWLGVAFGTYVASMGLFAYGCAGGNCYNLPSKPDSKQNTKKLQP